MDSEQQNLKYSEKSLIDQLDTDYQTDLNETRGT
jgi:hypothetical protein